MASSSWNLLRTNHPATGVEHSIEAKFFGPWENNLLIAGTNNLRVFRLVPDLEGQMISADRPKMKMECLATYQLYGEIMGLQKVTLPGSIRDTILISFAEAKLSVVEYDPHSHDLKTVSLHVFEDEESKGGYVHNFSIPYLRADPDGRCAAMLVYGRKIVILPFRRESSAVFSSTEITEEEAIVQRTSKVLSSYCLDLKAVIQTNRVQNIIDIQFLHGYNQPTLAILYEPLQTFAGRIAVRKDTCRLDVLTLDVKERVSAFIWSREILPFDSVKILSVPKPIGGILVFSVNALFFLNQGIPPYAVSLNSLGDMAMEGIAQPMEGVKLTLDCAQAEFITSERAVISLKGGELYVLSLIADAMRTVKGFHFDRAAASVLTTCLSVCENHYLFLGSRLGNSLLLQFTEKEVGSIVNPGLQSANNRDNQPPNKKKKIDQAGGGGVPDWLASDVGDIQDIDLEVYGTKIDELSTTVTSVITSYNFEVCDSILNIGPCGHLAMGQPFFISEQLVNSAKADPDVEIVSTSGHGKNGALCVLQQTIRPNILSSFTLTDINDVWTVAGTEMVEGKLANAFIILSKEDSTMILQTAQEINELDKSGFFTDSPTIYCGNLGNNKCIIQVGPNVIRLLEGSTQLQNLPLNLGSPLIHVSAADPYMIAVTEDGQMILICLEWKGGQLQPELSVIKANLKSKSRIIAACAYKDVSGLFTTETPEEIEEVSQTVVSAENNTNNPDVDDEDELLYGESAPSLFDKAANEAKDSGGDDNNTKSWKKYLKTPKVTYWTIALKENGNLEIMSLPDFSVKFLVQNFNLANSVVTDTLFTTSTPKTMPAVLDIENVPKITEIQMVGLGDRQRRPLLLARTADHELIMYEVYPYYEKLTTNQLKMRLKRIKHGLILRERKSRTKKTDRPLLNRTQIRYFQNIAGYEGLFICGPYPHWIFLTNRGELRTHPMGIDSSIPCFAEFHNINCKEGFIYFNRKAELRICVLSTHLQYDAPWPVRKVPLRCTPHFVAYHLESKTYAVVTSTSETTNKVWKFNGDDKELVEEERDDRFPWPTVDSFFVQLYSPMNWEAIPGTKLNLDSYERCTGMKHLYLTSEGLHSGEKGYIVCATAYCYGEDVTPRGYIRIYDIIEVNPEPGQPLTKNKIKPVYEKEQKGPITAVDSVNGFLVATVGQKVYIFQFKNQDLFGVAFIDSQIYVHTIATMKNFIFIGDVMKSVDLLEFQQDYRTCAVIARDPRPMEVYAVEFVVDNNTLGFVATDADKNITLFMYQPESRESMGGQKLVRKADFHIGQHVNHMFRIRAKITDPSAGGRILTGWEKRHVLWFATLDGALGYLLPCSEKTYRRLLMLQNVLVNSLPHIAGLNPKGFRTLKQRRKELLNPSRGIIDGELVFSYSDLPYLQKNEIARKIGTRLVDIMDDLAELDRMAAHF